MPSLKNFFGWYSNTPRPAPYTWIINYGAFRYGQPITEDDYERAINRSPVCNFAVKLLPKQAFQEGFEVQTKNGEKVPWSDEFEESFDVKEACQIERGYGAVTMVIFDDPVRDSSRVASFKPKHVSFDVDERGDFAKFALREYISQDKQPVIHNIPAEENGSELADIIHVVLRPDKYRYRGTSILDPLWDDNKGRTSLMQSAALLTNRVASGIKKATYYDRGDDTENATTKANYENAMRAFEAGDTVIALMKEKVGDEFIADEIEVTQADVGQFNFSEKLSMFNMSIALALSVPKNVIEGILKGETVGATAVLEMLYTSYRIIQKDWQRPMKRVAKRWAELNRAEWSPEFKIVWNQLETSSEKEQAEIDLIKANTYSTYYNAGIMLLSEIRKKLDLDDTIEVKKPASMSFDMSGIAPEQQQQQQQL